MTTLADIEASVRAGTDHDTDTQATQPQIYAWTNEEVPLLVRRLASSIPDRYTAISPGFTVASGNSQLLTAAPTSLTDFSRLRCVQLQDGTIWSDLPLAPAASPETSGYLGFRQRGAATVDLHPAALLPGRTFRVKYLYKPAKLTAGADVVDLPEGAEQALIALIAGRVRHREDLDAGYWQAERQRIWTEVVQSLIPLYVGASQGIVDVSGRY
jgi:hypothetical protein